MKITTDGSASSLPQRILVPTPMQTSTRKLAGKVKSSLTAAADRLKEPTNKRSAQRGSTTAAADNWQADAWDMYTLVGEQRFVATTLAARLAQARLYVGKSDPAKPGDRPDEVKDNPVLSGILEAFGDSRSGRSQMLYRSGVNLFVVGEVWNVGIPHHLLDPDYNPNDDPEAALSPTGMVEDQQATDYQWFTLSTDEVATSKDGATVTLSLPSPDGSGSMQVEAPVGELFMFRTWRPHPRYAWQPDSPVRSSLPVLREIVGLTMRVGAQTDSRLAGAGVFIVPASARDAVRQEIEDAGEEADSDPFTPALVAAMMEPVADRDSAAALVPLVITAPDESAEKFRHLSFSDEIDEETRELRSEALRRLALGEDVPPELLLGTAGMNHWGAWLVQEDVVTTHLTPPLELICDALTTQYLWPMMLAAGFTEEQVEAYSINYDVDHLIVRPNHATEALALHERGLLSDEAVLRACGFDPADEAGDDDGTDPVIALAVAMVQRAPSLAQEPGIVVLAQQLRQLYASANTKVTTDTTTAAPPGGSEDTGESVVPTEPTTTGPGAP